nr:LOW QUALITY PROTEIN: putative TP73 antisense gene protein 1 [Vicugna pacos]
MWMNYEDIMLSDISQSQRDKHGTVTLRVRRDRILGHLSSGGHCRNRRLGRQLGVRSPPELVCQPAWADRPTPAVCHLLSSSAAWELAAAGLASHPSHPSLRPQPPLVLPASPASACTGVRGAPSPPTGHTSLGPGHPSALSLTTSDVPTQVDQTVCTSTANLAAFPALQMERPSVPSKQANQTLFQESSDALVSRGGMRQLPDTGAGAPGRLGQAVFGDGFGSEKLFQSLMGEDSCCLLYVIEDQLCDVEHAFRAEFGQHTGGSQTECRRGPQ